MMNKINLTCIFLLAGLILLIFCNVFLTIKIKKSRIEREELRRDMGKIEVLGKNNRTFIKDVLKQKAIMLCFWELIEEHKRKYNRRQIKDCIQLIAVADEKYGHKGLDAPLILAWLEKESGGNPDAVSYAGAKGLTQLMDFRAKEVLTAMGYLDYDKELVFKPMINLEGGLSHFTELMDFWRYRGIKNQSLILFYALHSYKWGTKNTEELFNTGRKAYRPATEYVHWILNQREYWKEKIKYYMKDVQKLKKREITFIEEEIKIEEEQWMAN